MDSTSILGVGLGRTLKRSSKRRNKELELFFICTQFILDEWKLLHCKWRKHEMSSVSWSNEKTENKTKNLGSTNPSNDDNESKWKAIFYIQTSRGFLVNFERILQLSRIFTKGHIEREKPRRKMWPDYLRIIDSDWIYLHLQFVKWTENSQFNISVLYNM